MSNLYKIGENMNINTQKQVNKEFEICKDNIKNHIIPVVDKNGNLCVLNENDEIIIVRNTGRKEKATYFGESIKYKEYGHWYYSDSVHNKDSYCSIYTNKGSLKYLVVLLYSSYTGNVTHISEDRISKIIINN